MAASSAGSVGNQPLSQQEYLRAVESLIRAGDHNRAAKLAAEAVAAGHQHANLLILAAHDALSTGDFEKARSLASRARTSTPRHPDVLHVLGLSLVKLRRHREAIEVYDAALQITPNAAHLHFNKGIALEELNAIPAARAEYQRTLRLDQKHSDAYARLANMAVFGGNLTEGRALAEQALRFNPQNSAALLSLAAAHVQEKNFDSAAALLVPMITGGTLGWVNTSIAQGLLGDALDGLDRTDEAFAMYTASNRTGIGFYQPGYERPDLESAPARARRLISYFDTARAEDWQISESGDPQEFTHVFLVGFPRSGTTLLEQVLAAHPDVETLEERDCLAMAIEDFVVPAEGLSRLAQLSGEALAPYRQAYWAATKQYGAKRDRRVFVDKLPLNSVILCLVAKLFPQAKILFAVRDPRDVVFSCFRRRFDMNLQMYELLTISNAAAYYDAVMTLSELYREKLNLPTHYIRNEDLVRDFDGHVRKLCQFLDIPFSESMTAFAEKSRERAINTPSATQISRGLYTESIGQWRRYESHLTPVRPILKSWAARFGYAES